MYVRNFSSSFYKNITKQTYVIFLTNIEKYNWRNRATIQPTLKLYPSLPSINILAVFYNEPKLLNETKKKKKKIQEQNKKIFQVENTIQGLKFHSGRHVAWPWRVFTLTKTHGGQACVRVFMIHKSWIYLTRPVDARNM